MQLISDIGSLATAGALAAALWQLRQANADARRRDDDRRVERSLALYQALVAEGATYEGFHRLSVLLRRLGTEQHSRTTWYVLGDDDLSPGGCLDPTVHDREQAFADLYAVLWFFERYLIALRRKLVSEEVLMETIGFHFWWWGQVLRELRGPKSTIAVHQLALTARRWAHQNGALLDWEQRCLTDFGNGPPVYAGGDLPRVRDAA